MSKKPAAGKTAPGAAISGQVRSTMTNPFGKKSAKRAGAKRGGRGASR